MYVFQESFNWCGKSALKVGGDIPWAKIQEWIKNFNEAPLSLSLSFLSTDEMWSATSWSHCISIPTTTYYILSYDPKHKTFSKSPHKVFCQDNEGRTVALFQVGGYIGPSNGRSSSKWIFTWKLVKWLVLNIKSSLIWKIYWDHSWLAYTLSLTGFPYKIC